METQEPAINPSWNVHLPHDLLEDNPGSAKEGKGDEESGSSKSGIFALLNNYVLITFRILIQDWWPRALQPGKGRENCSGASWGSWPGDSVVPDSIAGFLSCQNLAELRFTSKSSKKFFTVIVVKNWGLQKEAGNFHPWKYMKFLAEALSSLVQFQSSPRTEQEIRLDGFPGFIQTYPILWIRSCRPLSSREILEEHRGEL